MYTILGATGNVGEKIVRRLLAKRLSVRAVARNAAKLPAGVDAALGRIDDVPFLIDAMRGAEAVFTMIPPDAQAASVKAQYDRMSESICEAVQGAGVRWIVNLSSVGADLPSGTGPVQFLHAHEQRMDRLDGINILHLRPTFFMENLLANVPLLRAKGILGGVFKPDLPVPMIASEDVAEVAAQKLVARDFSGKQTMLLLGNRDLTMKEVSAIVSEVLGRDVPYIQFDLDAAREGMVGMGLSADFADQIVELQNAFNTGHLSTAGKRTKDNTTGTRFEDFAKVFKAAV